MKIIQTLHINLSKDPYKYTFGWAAPEYHLMGWALSCLQLKQFNKDVYLYANSPAARLLIDELQLPYSDDVLRNHYEVFENLIFSSIKQLVVKKAIKPVTGDE